MNIKEYIIIVNNETFRVYSDNKINAIKTLLSVCIKYADTENEKYRKYWLDIHQYIKEESCIVMENEDFCGVRKVL